MVSLAFRLTVAVITGSESSCVAASAVAATADAPACAGKEKVRERMMRIAVVAVEIIAHRIKKLLCIVLFIIRTIKEYILFVVSWTI